jgi:hypothetical protein
LIEGPNESSLPGLINLLPIESLRLTLTSSLAIAVEVVRRLM